MDESLESGKVLPKCLVETVDPSKSRVIVAKVVLLSGVISIKYSPVDDLVTELMLAFPVDMDASELLKEPFKSTGYPSLKNLAVTTIGSAKLSDVVNSMV